MTPMIFRGLAVRHDAPADRGSIAAEFALPVAVGQDARFPELPGRFVFRREPPAENRLDAEGVERA